MSEQSKIYGEIVGEVETAAALSLGCLEGEWTKEAPAARLAPDEAQRQHRIILAFLEELRAAWDLEQSSLYVANRAELEAAANPWNGGGAAIQPTLRSKFTAPTPPLKGRG